MHFFIGGCLILLGEIRCAILALKLLDLGLVALLHLNHLVRNPHHKEHDQGDDKKEDKESAEKKSIRPGYAEEGRAFTTLMESLSVNDRS